MNEPRIVKPRSWSPEPLAPLPLPHRSPFAVAWTCVRHLAAVTSHAWWRHRMRVEIHNLDVLKLRCTELWAQNRAVEAKAASRAYTRTYWRWLNARRHVEGR